MVVFRPITEEEIKYIEKEILYIPTLVVETICEHIRIIYKTVDESVEDQTIKNILLNECKVTMIYAKRMSNKLQQVKESRL
jgi:hypothetical protein